MLTVEHAGPDDWERVRAIRLRALADTPEAFGTTLADEQTVSSDAWRERLGHPGTHQLLAVLDGRDVGLAVGAEYDRVRGDADPGAAERDGPTDAGLFGMFVAPEARGHGVGEALISAMVSWARTTGHARLLLDVGDANVPAQRLYARLGFVRTGVTGTLPPPRTHLTEHQLGLDLS